VRIELPLVTMLARGRSAAPSKVSARIRRSLLEVMNSVCQEDVLDSASLVARPHFVAPSRRIPEAGACPTLHSRSLSVEPT
jgi:hypothetical protein